MFFGFMKQTENNQNRLSFGLFRFFPKTKFDCFEDTLLDPHPRNLDFVPPNILDLQHKSHELHIKNLGPHLSYHLSSFEKYCSPHPGNLAK